MHCGNCGAEIEPGTKFCGNCGAEVPEMEHSDHADEKKHSGERPRVKIQNKKKSELSTVRASISKGHILVLVGAAAQIISLFVPMITVDSTYTMNSSISSVLSYSFGSSWTLSLLTGWNITVVIIFIVITAVEMLFYFLKKYGLMIIGVVLSVLAYILFMLGSFALFVDSYARTSPGIAVFLYPIGLIAIIIGRNYAKKEQKKERSH